MALGFVMEVLWSFPLLVLSALIPNFLAKVKPGTRIALSVALCVLLGITYATAIAAFSGPMVTAVPIPLLPFMATVGAFTGLVRTSANLRDHTRWPAVYLTACVVSVLWIGYFVLRHKMISEHSFRLVVVEADPSPESLRLQEDHSSITLNEAERSRVQEAIGVTQAVPLKLVLSLSIGEHPHRTVILVMAGDVSERTQFEMPDSGVVVLIQNQDGTWRKVSRDVHRGSDRVTLSPVPGSTLTRIDVEGPFGTESSEIRVSRK
jgi:hypothetical protein